MAPSDEFVSCEKGICTAFRGRRRRPGTVVVDGEVSNGAVEDAAPMPMRARSDLGEDAGCSDVLLFRRGTRASAAAKRRWRVVPGRRASRHLGLVFTHFRSRLCLTQRAAAPRQEHAVSRRARPLQRSRSRKRLTVLIRIWDFNLFSPLFSPHFLGIERTQRQVYDVSASTRQFKCPFLFRHRTVTTERASACFSDNRSIGNGRAW
jgi:hypothetical protein